MDDDYDPPLVYVGMSADFLHIGHIGVINVARKHGKVLVGVLTDEAIGSYKRKPMLPWAQRAKLVWSVKGVSCITRQNTLSYRENLLIYTPMFVVHGDDWREGPQKETRQEVIDTLAQWGGVLVEPPYTPGVSSTQIIEYLKTL